MVYLGFIIALIVFARNKSDIMIYAIPIIIIGGFMFSIFWEAKARYIFPYFMIMLPYASIGIDRIYNKELISKLKHIKNINFKKAKKQMP